MGIYTKLYNKVMENGGGKNILVSFSTNKAIEKVTFVTLVVYMIY